MEARRHEALDALRGLTIFLMIPVNAGMDFREFPAFLKHAPGSGMTLADFIMPAFLVALGVSSSLSIRKRLAAEGFTKVLLHAFKRYALLFAFGSIGYFLVWRQDSWEILQMLGLTGALAFPFLFLPPLARIASALALSTLVEFLRPVYFGPAYQLWYASGIGGPAGTFALASLPILASAVGELLRGREPWRRARVSGATGLLLLAGGLAATFLLGPPNKHLLTPAYLLISSGTAFLALAILELPCALRGDLPLLGAMGRNPLFGYMASGVLILGLRAWLPETSPAAIAWSAVIAVTAAIGAASLVMDRRGLWIRL